MPIRSFIPPMWRPTATCFARSWRLSRGACVTIYVRRRRQIRAQNIAERSRPSEPSACRFAGSTGWRPATRVSGGDAAQARRRRELPPCSSRRLTVCLPLARKCDGCSRLGATPNSISPERRRGQSRKYCYGKKVSLAMLVLSYFPAFILNEDEFLMMFEYVKKFIPVRGPVVLFFGLSHS
jgi:hypothetical protein